MNKKYVWKNEYSVAVKEIDDQHKQLFNIINTLYDSIKTNNIEKMRSGILTKLIRYTSYHFQTEEKYMEKINYKGITEHKKIHQDFINDLEKYVEEIFEGKPGLTITLLVFLQDWLVNHIIKEDKKIVSD